jgi:hypothetical protein
MKFNPDKALTLTYDNPEVDRLSRNTCEQDQRFRTALHESHHLMGAVLFDSWVTDAYVPRPGQSPPGMRHAAGSIMTHGQRTMANGIGTLLGPMSEGLTQGSFRNPQSKWDLEAIYTHGPSRTQPRYEEYEHTPGLIYEMKRRALAIALGHAAEIDLAACSMLYMSVVKKGKISSKNMQDLYAFLREVMDNECGAIRGQLDGRILFINTLPYLKHRYPEGLTPNTMKQFRQRIRNEGYLNTKIPKADFAKYGLAA